MSTIGSALAALLLYAAAADVFQSNNNPMRQGCFPDEEAPSHIRLIYSIMLDNNAKVPSPSTPRHEGRSPSTKRRRRRSPAASTASTSSTESLSSSGETAVTTTTTTTAAAAVATSATATQSTRPWGPRQSPTATFVTLPANSLTSSPRPVRVAAVQHLPRLFIGQLKKDCAADMAVALVAALAPHAVVVHAESLMNTTTGQGRGCAWLYMASHADAAAVRQLHHRVFIDISDSTNTVGFWLCGDSDKDNLRLYSEERVEADLARRKRRMLPRQLLVVEDALRSSSHLEACDPYSSQSAAAAAVPWAHAAPHVLTARSPVPLGQFPRLYPSAGVVFVSPNRYRREPYHLSVVLPPYSAAVGHVQY